MHWSFVRVFESSSVDGLRSGLRQRSSSMQEGFQQPMKSALLQHVHAHIVPDQKTTAHMRDSQLTQRWRGAPQTEAAAHSSSA